MTQASTPRFLSQTTEGVRISDGESTQQVTAEVTSLLENGWELDENKAGVQKVYYFKTYTKALDFLSSVGIRSKAKNHHSVMTIKSGSVAVHWTTHVPPGLSIKDTFMAKWTDGQAKIIGTVPRVDAQNCHQDIQDTRNP